MIIKRIDPVSAAKISGTLYAAIGLFLAVIFSLVQTVASSFFAHSGFGRFGAALGIGAIIFLPLMYGLFGFVITFLAAWLYNVIARLVGGIRIDVE